ncbi:MAG: aminotransferase class I/II-fold pyridoxal phosphate-dependent enzyme [Desulfobacterales bacterium]
MKKHSKDTDIVHGVSKCHITSLDLVPPIHMTSTYKFNSAEHGAKLFAGNDTGYIYTRISNPTVDLLQEKVALLEGAESAIATASGMASVSCVSMTLAAPGDNFVSCTTLYGGTFALFNAHLPKFGMEPRFLSPSDANSASSLEALADEKTRFLYLETPANPTLDVIDIRLWADTARSRSIPLIVDNTFASPYLQNPLELGADIVIHSATKYLSGHGDVVGGIIAGKQDMMARIREQHLIHFGPIMSPFNAWLISRGIKTLALRMERHCSSAMTVAQYLEVHPRVQKVYYPGLKSHPGHQTAQKQMKKYGGMIAFEVKGGIKAGKKVMNSVKLCTLAVSLGDCETLIQHPASMTHATYSPEERKKAGIADGLIRLSVGLEHPDDIMADLDYALKK